jgi:hypothetical protein
MKINRRFSGESTLLEKSEVRIESISVHAEILFEYYTGRRQSPQRNLYGRG